MSPTRFKPLGFILRQTALYAVWYILCIYFKLLHSPTFFLCALPPTSPPKSLYSDFACFPHFNPLPLLPINKTAFPSTPPPFRSHLFSLVRAQLQSISDFPFIFPSLSLSLSLSLYIYIYIYIYIYKIRYLIIFFSFLFSNYSTYVSIFFFSCSFVFLFSILCVLFFVLFCVFFSFCAASFIFLYKSTYHCHRVETQLQ